MGWRHPMPPIVPFGRRLLHAEREREAEQMAAENAAPLTSAVHIHRKGRRGSVKPDAPTGKVLSDGSEG